MLSRRRIGNAWLAIFGFAVAGIVAAPHWSAATVRREIGVQAMIPFSEIATIKVLAFPERNPVRIALKPERLLANYTQQFELSRGPQWEKFVAAIEKTTLLPSSDVGDHRWAILFRDSGGRTKHTLAVDRLRRIASLDGQSYNIRGDLLSWLKAQSKLLGAR